MDVSVPARMGRDPGTWESRNHTTLRWDSILMNGYPETWEPRNHKASERKHRQQRPCSSQRRVSLAELRGSGASALLHFFPSLTASWLLIRELHQAANLMKEIYWEGSGYGGTNPGVAASAPRR